MPRKRSDSVEEHASQLTPRFYTLNDVATLLASAEAQAYAMVRSGDLLAIKIGGRGQWRIEVTVLDEWIGHQYERTATYIRENPIPESDRPGKRDTSAR
ncbi:helix-turn-helix domain-containing protein [Terrabacter sp. GCM10028922]|uniref:helix-turn-helix domain-containing protein n=1 Tax=Terrabacter sp. GCM10028922 TaxID=3273428 RepID=UPI003623084A